MTTTVEPGTAPFPVPETGQLVVVLREVEVPDRCIFRDTRCVDRMGY